MTKGTIKTNLNEILNFIKFAGSSIPTEHYSWDSEKYDWIEALNETIKMVEQEPCEDATLKDIFCMGCEYKEQEPKTGHWIDTGSESFEFHRVYKCSECGNTEIEYPERICRHFRYCPNCGARMIEI